MTPRRRLAIGMASALLLVAAITFVALRDNGGGGGTLSAGAGDDSATTTPTSEVGTTTSESAPPPSTTSAPTRPSIGSRPPPPPPTTAVAKPLLLSEVRVGVGAPCRDASTTTTASGTYVIDGCFFFVFWPLTEKDVNVALHSSRGFSGDLIGPPCQEKESRCVAYIGPVYDRAVDERECFWLTTPDAGWAQKSDEVCINWPARS